LALIEQERKKRAAPAPSFEPGLRAAQAEQASFVQEIRPKN